MTKKDSAISFLTLASSGQVREAYEKHVHPAFLHHNAYFKGDRESLLRGMEENARKFPAKSYTTLRALEEGNLVTVHGKVALAPESRWSVIHIFRFEDDLIIEEWEASQQVIEASRTKTAYFKGEIYGNFDR